MPHRKFNGIFKEQLLRALKWAPTCLYLDTFFRQYSECGCRCGCSAGAEKKAGCGCGQQQQ